MSSLATPSHPRHPDRGHANAAPAQTSSDIPRLSSERLLGPAGEAVIEHEGHHYRLRRTGRGGLVLTK